MIYIRNPPFPLLGSCPSNPWIWLPHLPPTKLTNCLEGTQHFACRVILQDWKQTHDNLLLKADLPLLSKCRDFATLCQLFKIVCKLCSSPNPNNPHPHPGLNSMALNLNSMALNTPFCLRSLTQKSFYPYAPTLWNYLPDSTVKCPTLIAFKSAISQLFASLFSPFVAVFGCVFVFVWCSFFLFFKASLQFSWIICTIGFCLASHRIVINNK